MGQRIVASLVVVAALGQLLWVAFGGDATESTEMATGDSDETAEGADDTTTVPGAASAGDDGSASDTPDSPPSPESTLDDQPNEGDEPSESDGTPEPRDEQRPSEPEGLENLGPRMDLVELDGWLNTDATSIDDFDGQVLLVEMWTFGCHNCKARIPYNQGYYEEFADQNFEIIGVHAPEFSYEADVANIENALVDLGVTWPVALDTEKRNFRSWQPGSRNFWPRTYVIDQNGDVRYDHIGEGRYEELREVIRYLVENPPAPTTP